MNEKIIEFVSLCIETYKKKYKKSGQEVIVIFDEYGVTEFLADGYDVLHTQAIQYVIFLEKHKNKTTNRKGA